MNERLRKSNLDSYHKIDNPFIIIYQRKKLYNMKKKVLSIALVTVMVLGVSPLLQGIIPDARPGVNFVRANRIMSGDGTNFNPAGLRENIVLGANTNTMMI